MQLRIENAGLQLHIPLLVDEARAYRRSRLLNAFLGTGIQGIGTGLQLTSSKDVQRAGNILGVVGGGLTIVSALCTAELENPDPKAKAAIAIIDSVADNNKENLIPASVWGYLRDYTNKDFFDHMQKEALPKPLPEPNKRKAFLACEYNKKGNEEKVEKIEIRLSEINEKLDEINQALVRISKPAAQ